MDFWGFLAQIVLLLAAALVAGGVLSRCKQSPLLGYILAGMFLGGPGSLGLIHSQQDIALFAELGVSLLLFSLGLEFSWNRLRRFGTRALLGGALQVVVTLVVVAALARMVGASTEQAIALGAMLSLSSTAAVLRVLMEGGEADSLHGRGSIAILLAQDVAVVPLALLVTLLGSGGSGGDVALDVGRVLLVTVGLVAALYFILNKLAVWGLRTLALHRSRELTILLAVVVGLGSTWAAHAAGISPALGAFVAGMFLGSSPFATQVRADVSSLRVVLLTLFFAAAGIVADPIWIANHAPLVLGVTAAVLALKTVIVTGVSSALRQPLGVAIATGMCVSQVGEFAFVLGGTALEQGVLAAETYSLVVSVAIVSLFATPYLAQAAPRVCAYVQARRSGGRSAPTDAGTDAAPLDVVIVGFGPTGQAVGRVLASCGVAGIVLDLNAEAPRRAAELGLRGEVGDALQLDVLEHVGVERANTVVITLPSRLAALTVLRHVRALNPNAHTIVRTRYKLHLADFEAAGAHVVVDDEVEAGRRLAEHVRARASELRQEQISAMP